MATVGKKLAVLRALQSHKHAISLPELLTLLPTDYAERSVRRWLAELADEGKVAKSGQKRGTRYQSVENRRTQEVTQQKPLNIFNSSSINALEYVRQPIYKRKPTTYNQLLFDSYQPNQTGYFKPEKTEELVERGQRGSNQEPAGTYARRIYDRLLIDLSYHSSRLEGNTYSLIDTKRLLIEGMGVEGKLDEEKVMILNHKEAIRHLVDNARRIDVSYDEICTLHYLLADGLVPVRFAGKVRDHGVRIGASTYIPLESEERLLKQLTTIATKASLIANPYEQSLFLLVHIAYLQAFTDVNKRTSRLCANIPLIKNNLVPLSFNAIEKDDYAAAMLAIYELNEIQPLIDLYYASYLYSCQQYDVTAESLGFDEIRVRYRQQRREIIKEIIVDQLVGESIQTHIDSRTAQLIPEKYREDFTEDINEDLCEISPQRIAGMGITQQQLQRWIQLREKNL